MAKNGWFVGRLLCRGMFCKGRPHPCLLLWPFCVFFGILAPVEPLFGLRKGKMPSLLEPDNFWESLRATTTTSSSTCTQVQTINVHSEDIKKKKFSQKPSAETSDVIHTKSRRPPASFSIQFNSSESQREEEPAAAGRMCRSIEQDFRSVIPASQFLAGPARARTQTGLLGSRLSPACRCDGGLIFSRGREESTQPTVASGRITPPPQLTDALPNPVGGDRCISPSLRPRHRLCFPAGRSDPNPDTYISCRLFEFWGLTA